MLGDEECDRWEGLIRDAYPVSKRDVGGAAWIQPPPLDVIVAADTQWPIPSEKHLHSTAG